MENVLNFEYRNGNKLIFPNHHFVKSWQFMEFEEDEALLAEYIARIAEKNKLSANKVMHLYPNILKMLKSKSVWAD